MQTSLNIISSSCLQLQGIFPSEWEKPNAEQIHKKEEKQCVKNYWPVSLLPTCSEVLEYIIYNMIFSYFTENNLNQNLSPMILVSINYYPLLINYFLDLLEEHSLTFEKFLIKYGTRKIFILKGNRISGKSLTYLLNLWIQRVASRCTGDCRERSPPRE